MKFASGKTTSLRYNPEFRIGVREIIYNHNKQYNENEHLMLEHKDLNINDNLLKEWAGPKFAAGLIIDNYYTNLVALDMDNMSLTDIVDLANKYIKQNDIIAADIIQSSVNLNGTTNYHIYLGLSQPKYTLTFVCNETSCRGFRGITDKRGESTIRLSKTWTITNNTLSAEDNEPENILAIRKINGEVYTYAAKQMQNAVYSISNKIKSNKIRTLRLRG